MTDDIRQRHVCCEVCRDYYEGPVCHECQQDWPCDAIRMADARDEWEAHSRRWMEHAGKVAAERDAANADAERLAEALVGVIGADRYVAQASTGGLVKFVVYLTGAELDAIRAALAAHDERVR